MNYKNSWLISFMFMLVGCGNGEKQSVTHEETGNSKMIFVTPEGGKEWNVFGVQITGKIMSEATDGDYTVIMSHTPPEGGPPLHVHKNEDELFYVLKGKYLFTCGDEKIQASEGSFVRLPRGVPHNFRNIGTEEGITMNTITPGGFEGFFDDIARLSKEKPLSREQVDSIANLYGLKFLR